MDENVASGKTLLDPVKILQHVGVGFGQKFVDLGCGGAGYFVLQAAKMVGERGKVYAVDVVKAALSSLESRAKTEGVSNVQTVWSNLEVYNAAKVIENESLDIALAKNVLFQSKKHIEFLKEAHRMLKQGGKLVVIDWRPTSTPVGPPISTRVTEEQVRSAAQAAGFTESGTFDAGKFHYGIIFKKP